MKRNIACSLILIAAAHGRETKKQGLVEDIVANYADLVLANYRDALETAESMDQAIADFAAKPSRERLLLARSAWLAARSPYGQSEVFRFYEGPIDDEENGPEGLLNSWPMDESYVDAVEGNPNSGIIRNPSKYPKIDATLLLGRNQKDGETNVSCGYHAIEFILWGQDLAKGSAGKRALTDFTKDKHARRRLDYLKACSGLIVGQLDGLVGEWEPGKNNYRKRFLSEKPKEGLRKILQGMGMLSGFELSGERMLVAYETRSQEDEHSCFSDNTHNDIAFNAKGLLNVYEGKYVHSVSRKVTSGPGIRELLKETAPGTGKKIDEAIRRSYLHALSIPAPFDMAIEDRDGRAKIKQTIDSLVLLAKEIKGFADHLKIDIAITE